MWFWAGSFSRPSLTDQQLGRCNFSKCSLIWKIKKKIKKVRWIRINQKIEISKHSKFQKTPLSDHYISDEIFHKKQFSSFQVHHFKTVHAFDFRLISFDFLGPYIRGGGGSDPDKFAVWAWDTDKEDDVIFLWLAQFIKSKKIRKSVVPF